MAVAWKEMTLLGPAQCPPLTSAGAPSAGQDRAKPGPPGGGGGLPSPSAEGCLVTRSGACSWPGDRRVTQGAWYLGLPVPTASQADLMRCESGFQPRRPRKPFPAHPTPARWPLLTPRSAGKEGHSQSPAFSKHSFPVLGGQSEFLSHDTRTRTGHGQEKPEPKPGPAPCGPGVLPRERPVPGLAARQSSGLPRTHELGEPSGTALLIKEGSGQGAAETGISLPGTGAGGPCRCSHKSQLHPWGRTASLGQRLETLTWRTRGKGRTGGGSPAELGCEGESGFWRLIRDHSRVAGRRGAWVSTLSSSCCRPVTCCRAKKQHLGPL